MNRQKLLLKRGFKGRMNDSFFQGINSLPEKWQNALTSQETTLKKKQCD